ncbi:MAG TPA: antibiotic biosynthesis monooxygenase family protein [Bacteroidia bacterium]|jgi:quinol monooxygenase YgiN|nr:antibiotic biosynthesis monooxygenase family protein [Bacteroidia bacterium]
MIIRIVKMTFKPELVKDFLNLFNKNKNSIAGFEGCTHLELLNDKDNPAIFFTYSKWQDQSFLEKYRNSELFNTVWGQTKKFFDAKPEAWTVTKM